MRRVKFKQKAITACGEQYQSCYNRCGAYGYKSNKQEMLRVQREQ